jgi:pyrimidine oxygenase
MRTGVFLPSATSGYIMSTAVPPIDPTYALQREIAKLAEETGFDFVMSMIKHHGFGGKTRFWDEALDTQITPRRRGR